MANRILEQRLVDTNNRALIKYVFIGDGTALANTLLVDVSTLSNSLNTNGYIMSGNTDVKSVYKTAIKRIYGNCKANNAFKLQWFGTANTEIVTISSGYFDINFDAYGGAASIPFPVGEPGANGDIYISAVTPGATDSLTLFIDLKKNPQDYSAGQHADPIAFNQGRAAP